MAKVVAVDAGTTGVRVLAVDERARVTDVAYRELTQHYPHPGWVEHDPVEIWDAVRVTLAEIGGAARRSGRRGGRHRHHQPARDAGGVRPLDGAPFAPGHRLAGPPHRIPVRRPDGTGPPPAGARAHGPRPRPVLQRDQGGLAAAQRGARPAELRPEPLLLHRRHLDPVEPHRGHGRRRLRHRPLQRQPHPPARYGHPRLVRRALRPLRRPGPHAARGAPVGRPLRHRRAGGRRPRGRRPRRRPRLGHPRRPAGGALRAGLLRPGHGQGHLRDGQFRAGQRRHRATAPAPRG